MPAVIRGALKVISTEGICGTKELVKFRSIFNSKGPVVHWDFFHAFFSFGVFFFKITFFKKKYFKKSVK